MPLTSVLSHEDGWVRNAAAQALVTMYWSGRLDDGLKTKLLARRSDIANLTRTRGLEADTAIARTGIGVSVSSSPSDPVAYRPIGTVASSVREPIRPELIRRVEARLVLEPGLEPAVAALEVGAHLVVVYHLHRAQAWDARYIDELFTRRGPCRPNPIGVTLVRVVATEGSTISVLGLDAIDGSPILDIKPYKPIFDEPPVEPAHQ